MSKIHIALLREPKIVSFYAVMAIVSQYQEGNVVYMLQFYVGLLAHSTFLDVKKRRGTSVCILPLNFRDRD
jgi:hypothetical protein